MKKILVALMAVLALTMVSCKREDSKITVYVVKGALELPVGNCTVYYTDQASDVFGAITDPLDLFNDYDYPSVKTDALGVATINWSTTLSRNTLTVAVWDDVDKSIVKEKVTIQKGKDAEVTLKIRD